jgi:hypothetical protein
VHTDCWLPVLRTDEPIRVLVNVGGRGDRSSDACPVPVARTFEIERPYGTISMEWWGSPHRLYISTTADDGRALDTRGSGIEVYEDRAGSWLREYSHRITFAGEDLLERTAPEKITIEVLTADGGVVDTIHATYDTVQCSCSVPDYVAERP